ncbi:protein kinase domain-containing protein [Streptomyces sp. NRRL WC-3549]|uniref:protein kinase domain-containing protein n=1 Tax=Streptomyces sp. NRRL WC-3549 TaxID=1463925 RepID=UPI0004C7B876|nr:hypothetical protein [Streptomyces sp. NRRL WC-3549]
MGTGPAVIPPPAEAVSVLEGRFGRPLVAEPVSRRRGSQVWRLTGGHVRLALKADAPDGGTARRTVSEVGQEDAVLTALIGVGALDPAYRVAADAWEGGHWLAVRWIGGQQLWRALSTTRGPEGDRPAARPWLLGIARTWAERLALVHAAGWTHADVQPTNTLVDAGTAHLIDYALACGPTPVDRLPYRGALTHTTAPETADRLLRTTPDTHVQAEWPTDIWGLGASLFWCWTGHRPFVYGDGAPREEMLKVIAKAGTTPLSDARPWRFPQFEEAVTACLAPSPQDRPSAGELAALLGAL